MIVDKLGLHGCFQNTPRTPFYSLKGAQRISNVRVDSPFAIGIPSERARGEQGRGICIISMSKLFSRMCLFLITMGLIPSLNAQSLDQYLQTAAENNPELKSRFKMYLAALERVPQVGTIPDPELAFGVFVRSVETRVGPQEASVAISQAFPWFGELKARKEVEAQIAQTRYQVFENAKYKLFFDVKTVYNNLYVLSKAIDITRENIELLQTFKELAIVKFESGKGSFVDVLRIEMEVKELENQIAFLVDSRGPLHAQFEQLLNAKPGNIQFPDSLPEAPLLLDKQAIYDSILIESPALKRYDHEINSLQNQVEVAQKMGMPSFRIGASYINVGERPDVEIPDNGKDAFLLPQIGVRIPIYRSKYRSMIKERQIQQESVELARENKANELSADLERGYRDYLDAQRRISLYRDLTALSEQSLDLLIAEYTSANEDFEELIRMDRQVLKYELELEKARGDINTAVAFLDYLRGK